jgi:hypothetical protein
VFLDGRSLGTAPGAFTGLRPGEHLVVLDAGPGRREEKSVMMTAGSTHRVRFDFAEEPKPVSRAAVSSRRTPEETVEASAAPTIRRWTGYLTDEDCGATGGAQELLHLRCAERCIREGKAPMLYSRGKLYRIDGFESIEISKDAPLQFRGWLSGDTIHVTEP